jgi:ribose transport system permease protein
MGDPPGTGMSPEGLPSPSEKVTNSKGMRTRGRAEDSLNSRIAGVLAPVGLAGWRRERAVRLRRVFAKHGWSFLGLPLVIVAEIVYFSSRSEYFLTTSNFENVGRNLGPILLLALGEGFVIILAQIDISVGAIVGLSTVTTALAVEHWGPVGFLAAPLTGAAVGLVNGTIVAKFFVHSVIVTIGTMTAVRGIAFMSTNGQPVTADFPEAFEWIGIGTVGPLPAPLVIALGALVFSILLLRYTPYGPMLYATGGNEEAARLAGLNVFRIKVIAFVICGTLAGIAGLIYASRINSGQPNLGAGLELQAIAAAVVGGMALAGGKGTMTGVALGVVVLAILQNGLDITNVSNYTQQLVIGIVILVAVVVDRLRERAAQVEFGDESEQVGTKTAQ